MHDPAVTYAASVVTRQSRTVLGSTLAAVMMFITCACGAGTTRTTLSPKPDLSAVSNQYQALVEQLGTAAAAFNDGMEALPSTATAANVTAIASPYAAALHTYDGDLLRLAVPAPMTTNIQTLVNADAVLEKDLDGAATVTGFTMATWAQQITPDANRVVTASNVVRAELGLKPL
jgi:phosphoenolpyruvate carboxylase